MAATSTCCRCPRSRPCSRGLNLPRYPSVPGRMRAGRKPVAASTPARPPARLEKVLLVVPEGSSSQAEVLGHGADAAPAVVELLRQIGVV